MPSSQSQLKHKDIIKKPLQDFFSIDHCAAETDHRAAEADHRAAEFDRKIMRFMGQWRGLRSMRGPIVLRTTRVYLSLGNLEKQWKLIMTLVLDR